MDNQSQQNDPQPVAYDRDGQPLYAAPPSYAAQPAPQFVHLSRAVDPVRQQLTEEIKSKHDASTRAYPQLNLSSAEYIISAVKRHSIGLAIPVGLTAFMIAIIISLLFNYDLIVQSSSLTTAPGFGLMALGAGLVCLVLLAGVYIAIWVYTNNKFFLTNESVIQEIQVTMFSKREQTVSLANIEDVSYQQQGVMQLLFNYGSIRLSTEGEETTYRLTYVSDPKRQVAILNNAVEAFKNGRPVDDD